MSVTVRIPRVLSQAVTSGMRHQAAGETLAAVLENLFSQEPGLENHLLDEGGRRVVDPARPAPPRAAAPLRVSATAPLLLRS